MFYLKLIARNLGIEKNGDPNIQSPAIGHPFEGVKVELGAGLANVHGINFSPRLFAAETRLTMGHFPRGGSSYLRVYFAELREVCQEFFWNSFLRYFNIFCVCVDTKDMGWKLDS